MTLGAATPYKKQIAIISTVLFAIVVADQVTKALIIAKIPSYSVEWKQETFVWLTHEHNPGLVGGAFRGTPALALSLSLLATLVLIYLYRHLDPRSVWQSLAYGLVAGGAIGNMIDRIRLGHVTDFIQVHFYFVPFDFPWKRYPAFNVADAAICVGVVLLILTWRHIENESRRKEAKRKVANTQAAIGQETHNDAPDAP